LLGQTELDSTIIENDSTEINNVLGLESSERFDTINLSYFYLDNPENVKPFTDTTLVFLEDYDLLRQFEDFNLTLGNPASSHKIGLVNLPNDNIFTNTHNDNYYSLRSSVSDFRYYQLERPFNDLFFSPMGSQNEFFVKARFSTEFKEAVNLSLDYWRVSNSGDYQSQATKATSFNVGLWIKNPKKSHQTFLSFISNNFNEEYNGGATFIDQLSENAGLANIRTEAAVNISDADSRNEQYQIVLDNYFGKISDFNFFHRIRYQNFFFRYSDANVSSDKDILFYGNQYVENRGLRSSFQNDLVENTAMLSKKSKYVDLSVGLGHQYMSYISDGYNENYNDLSLNGNVSASLKNISLTGIGKIGLLDATENFLLNSYLSINAKKWFEFHGGFQIKQWKSNVIDRFILVSQIPVWNNAFNSILESNIYASFVIPKTSTSLSFVASTINDGIFYDQTASPFQTDENINSLRITVKQSISLGRIQSDHIVHFQGFDKNIQNLPNLLSKHKLFYKLNLFNKNLKANIGASYSQFYNQRGSIAYMPLTTIFYPSDIDMPDFHNLDFFINMKIQNFRVFFLAENATYLINRQVNFQIENVPQWDFKFRFGVRWIIMN